MIYSFLPVNPCCTDVVLNNPCGCSSTLPNTSCGQNQCGTNVTLSSNILYNGPTLDCIIAEPCDTLNVILQKIDEIICNLLTQINILNTQVNNITGQIININSQIININNTLDVCCNATTTTTTTTEEPTTTTTTTTITEPTTTTTTTEIIPTTTTTTTICDCYFFDIRVSNIDVAAADDGIVYSSFTDCEDVATIKEYVVADFYPDNFCAKVIPKDPILYYYVEGVETPAENVPEQGDFCCNPTTTTTTTTLT